MPRAGLNTDLTRSTVAAEKGALTMDGSSMIAYSTNLVLFSLMPQRRIADRCLFGIDRSVLIKLWTAGCSWVNVGVGGIFLDRGVVGRGGSIYILKIELPVWFVSVSKDG